MTHGHASDIEPSYGSQESAAIGSAAGADLGARYPAADVPGRGARQCERVNAADHTDNMMDWVEHVSVFDDDARR